MADRKLFYEDPALDRVETRVIEAGETEGRPFVRLEETVFYPEGGGQPPDRGTIAGTRVVDVQSRGEQVLHFLERPVVPGPVTARIDPAWRFDLRQQHTAQHLLTAVLADRHGRPTTSFHLGESYTAIEIEGQIPTLETLRELEQEVNERIRGDLPVRTRWVEPADLAALEVRTRGLPEGHSGLVRLVEIEGVDLNTCGGTHVLRLAEIQILHLLGAEPARGGARIRFLAGGRVLRNLHRLETMEEEVKARIGTGSEELARVLDGWQGDRKRLERKVRELESGLAGRLAAEIALEPGTRLVRMLAGAQPEFLRAVAAAIVGRRPEAEVVLVGEMEETREACFLVQSGPRGPEDVTLLGERLRDLLGAKGGGRGRLYQGRGGRWKGEDFLERALGLP